MSNRFDFQGLKETGEYFEGWYVKCTDPTNELSIALIPGIAQFSNRESFVQYTIQYKDQSFSGKVTFDRDDFHVVPEPYSILMPKFVLSEKGVRASLKDEKNDIILDFSFGPFLPIRQTAFMPSIMGPLEYLTMPCAHDIVSMKHDVSGTLIINGEKIVLDSAIGYMEKDRGHTFPSNYLWLQTNVFEDDTHAALSLAVATIEKKPLHLTGSIAIFHDGINEHRFATYLGTKHEVIVDNDGQGYTVVLTSLGKRLKTSVRLLNAQELIAPMNREMDFPIKESVKTELKVWFKEKGKPEVFLSSDHAAAELVNWKA